jgi:hypothetical protein
MGVAVLELFVVDVDVDDADDPRHFARSTRSWSGCWRIWEFEKAGCSKGNLLTWRETFLGTSISRRICDRSSWSSR